MFEQIVDPGSLSKPTPAEKGKFRVWFGMGAFLFGLALLVQLAHDYAHSPLFAHSRIAVLVLMVLGLGFQGWGLCTSTSISWQPWKKH